MQNAQVSGIRPCGHFPVIGSILISASFCFMVSGLRTLGAATGSSASLSGGFTAGFASLAGAFAGALAAFFAAGFADFFSAFFGFAFATAFFFAIGANVNGLAQPHARPITDPV